MKKLNIILLLAAIIGATSAFATNEDEIFVQTSPGIFQPLPEVGGRCVSSPGSVCTYTLKTNGDPNNPDDFNPMGINYMWQP